MSGQVKTASYLRPREKLKLRGVQALNDRELLQLIIGSGTAKIGVARLAKHVLKLFRNADTVTFCDLILIPGLGLAQAARLVAVDEFSRRFPRTNHTGAYPTNNDLPALLPVSSDGMWLVTLDGAHRLIERRMLDGPPGTSLIRQACLYILRDNAARAVVLKRVQLLEPALSDLALARNLKLATRTFEVKIDLVLVSGNDYKSVIKGDYGVTKSL